MEDEEHEVLDAPEELRQLASAGQEAGEGEGTIGGLSGPGATNEQEPAGEAAPEVPLTEQPGGVPAPAPAEQPRVSTPAPAEQPGAPAPLVELGLSEVRPSVLLRPGQEAGLVVLAEMDEPFRSLHIYVGQPEARAIQSGWHSARPARPGTWDLLLQAMELLGARLDKVVIDHVEEARHFFARIELERAGEFLTLACRPSDAIALAVRAPAAGIYATEEVLASAGRYPD